MKQEGSAPALDPIASAEHNADGFAVNAMFLFQNARRKRLHRVAVVNGNGSLDDDGSVVEVLVHEVNGAAADLHAVFERLVLRIQAREGGEQRRVDVQDSFGK